VCVTELIAKEKLASGGPASHLCCGWSRLLAYLPSSFLSFPLVLRRLLKLGRSEAKTGITFNFHSFPCSNALISSAHLSPNNSQSALPHQQTMGRHLLLDVFSHQSILHSSMNHRITKSQNVQGWKGPLWVI